MGMTRMRANGWSAGILLSRNPSRSAIWFGKCSMPSAPGEPVAAIAERVDMPRQLDRFQQRVARGDALPHRRLVENAELQHGSEITRAAVGMHAEGGLTILQRDPGKLFLHSRRRNFRHAIRFARF